VTPVQWSINPHEKNQGLPHKSSTATKDPAALLRAFASMLNDFYGGDADDTTGSPPPAPTAPQQAGLEFESTPTKHAASPAFSEGPWMKIEVHKEMGVTIKVQPEVYKKMIWLTENVPQMSHHKLTRMGLEAGVERLLTLHYRPEL
jgi:hypothetical protein